MEQSRSKDVALRACDGCRLRKIKCDFSHRATDDQPSTICRRCRKLKLSCTFDQPQRTRGRKKRQTQTENVYADQGAPSERLQPRLNDSPSTYTIDSQVSRHEYTGILVYMQNSAYQPLSPALSSWSRRGITTESPNDNSPIARNSSSIWATDDICTRSLLTLIIDDYLCLIYPLVPLIHRPSFIRDFHLARDGNDKDFRSLLVAMAASVVSAIPRRFRFYCSQPGGLRFSDRREMISYCYNVIMNNRGPDYFDQLSHCKWAIAYLMRLAFYHIGEHNRCRMLDVESMQMARLLYFHKTSEYEGLNRIEIQLRKKAFWLVFYAYVHNQLQNIRKERLSYLDPDILAALKLEDLLPLEVDDEMIFEESVAPQPSTKRCITTCFVIHSRVFWAALRSSEASSTDSDTCICHRENHPQIQITHLRARLRELKYMLDAIPPHLRQWAIVDRREHGYSSSPEDLVIEAQFQTMRANLHSTQIWLQSILLDHLDVLIDGDLIPELRDAPLSDHFSIWAEREELSRQLLHILHSIPHYEQEPNGLNITEKIRDVAVGLLSCPYPSQDESAKRAAGYIKDFTEIMARFEVDPVHTSNTQTWIDTDRLTALHHPTEISRSSDSPWS